MYLWITLDSYDGNTSTNTQTNAETSETTAFLLMTIVMITGAKIFTQTRMLAILLNIVKNFWPIVWWFYIVIIRNQTIIKPSS